MADDARGLGDYQPGRPGVSVAGLADGEQMTVEATGDVYLAETEQSDDAIHVPVFVHDAPEHLHDMSGSPLSLVGSDDEPTEYNIINSSTAFYNALVDEFGIEGETAGETFVITGLQPGEDAFSRLYQIDRQ